LQAALESQTKELLNNFRLKIVNKLIGASRVAFAAIYNEHDGVVSENGK
jgi:hypothetical protein